MKTIARRTWLLLCFAIACGSDSTSPSQNFAGTWTLKSVNGQSLPFVIAQTGANKVELASESFTFISGGAFTQALVQRTTQNGAVTTQAVTDAGTYAVNGTAVTLRYNDGTSFTGTWIGNTFSLALEGFALIFQR